MPQAAGGQKKLLELAAQSATFESAIVREFFDNPYRSTPTKDFDRRRITLRAEWEPCQTLHLLRITLGGVLRSTRSSDHGWHRVYLFVVFVVSLW